VTAWTPPKDEAPPPRASFSLAAVQMKLSVLKNRKHGGLTLLAGDEQEPPIARFPSMTFPAVFRE